MAGHLQDQDYHPSCMHGRRPDDGWCHSKDMLTCIDCCKRPLACRLLPPVLDAAAQAAKAYCNAAASPARRNNVSGSVMAGLLQLWGPLARLLLGAGLLAPPEALENQPIANVSYL
jgi:hypothetical protein